MSPRAAQIAGIAILCVIFACSDAVAAPLSEELAAARAAVKAGDLTAARAALSRGELAASAAATPVQGAELAALWLVQGVILRREHDPKGRYTDLWRQALVVDNALPWDESLIDDPDAFSLFEALRTEVRGRAKLPVGAPEAVGAAKLFIDGQRVAAGDSRYEGVHLAQITCPDGCTYSGWTTLKPPAALLSWCPGGVDTAAAPAEEADEFDGMGPVFGVQGGDEAPKDCPASTTAPRPSAAPPVVRGVGGGVAKASEPKAKGGGVKLPVVLMSSGGALLAGAVGVNFGLTAPRWRAVASAQEDPTGVSRAEADALTVAFNAARGLTIGLGVAGLGLGGAGVGLQLGQHTTVTGALTPAGAGLAGRF